MEQIETLAEHVRQAVIEGSYQAADRFSADYCRAVEEEVRGLELTDPRVPRILRECLDLLAWARHTAVTHRALAAARRAALLDRIPYAPVPPSSHAWVIEA